MPDWLKDNRTIPTATLVAVWVLCVFDWLGSGFLRVLRVSRFSEWIHGGVFSVTTFVAILFFFRAWDQRKGEGKAVRLWIVASIAWFPCWQVDTFFADLMGWDVVRVWLAQVGTGITYVGGLCWVDRCPCPHPSHPSHPGAEVRSHPHPRPGRGRTGRPAGPRRGRKRCQ